MSMKKRAYRLINSFSWGSAALRLRRAAREDRGRKLVASAGHHFIDRSKGCEKLCIVLAGYKQPLWDDVFNRLAAYLPSDVDVCIMTSGLENEELKSIADRNGWSYLSTDVNHLSLVQNLAIDHHPNAKWIYKIDEDMFITKGFFEKLLNTYLQLENNSLYVPAFVSPLVNVSCYGHLRLLQKTGLLEAFRETGMTDVKYSDGLHHNRQVIENPMVAEFMWGGSNEQLRDIDKLTFEFSEGHDLEYSICPVRFSIGAILFSRDSWLEFGKFPITFVGSEYGLGDDEEHICHYACFTGRVMAVNENVVVGHLGYGGAQTKHMMEYYSNHRAQFSLKDSY